MRPAIVAFAFGAAALATACDCSGDVSAPSETTETSVALPLAAHPGQALYEQYCGFCHGDDGQGYLADNAPALANQAYLTTVDDAYLRAAVVEGRPGTPMSAWGAERGGPLNETQVDAVVAYMRAWQTEPSVTLAPVDEGRAVRGRGPYRAYCASCHGDEGEGVTAVSLNNPWLLATASDEFLAHAIREGRPGTPMPAFGGEIPDRAIADITALIRSWETPVDGTVQAVFEPDIAGAVIHPSAPQPDFALREDRFVAADDVHAALEAGQSLIVLDARPTGDYLTSHITGATSLPFYDAEQYVDALPRDHWVITYCGCPHAVSGQLADALKAQGFTRVAVLDEGFYVWEERGYPVITRREGDDGSGATAEP